MDNKCIREAMSNPKLWRGSTRCLIDGIAVLACYETACLFETLVPRQRDPPGKAHCFRL
jgi:hypothetical protein